MIMHCYDVCCTSYMAIINNSTSLYCASVKEKSRNTSFSTSGMFGATHDSMMMVIDLYREEAITEREYLFFMSKCSFNDEQLLQVSFVFKL